MKLFEIVPNQPPPRGGSRLSPIAIALSKSDQLNAVKQSIAAIPQPDQAMFQQVVHIILGDIMKNNPQAAKELLDSHIAASQQGRTGGLNFKAKGGYQAMEALGKFIAAAKNPRLITINSQPAVKEQYVPNRRIEKLTLLETSIKKILS